MSKDINDPVHGLIRLNPVEAELLASRPLQRLHNIHQLGLAYLVFPGANYTRHAHSIGACHNAGRILGAINKNSNRGIIVDERAIDLYRMIGLLHDVGHYPFSHATEHVIEDYFKSGRVEGTILVPSSESGSHVERATEKTASYYKHEALGEFIIRNDREIGAALKRGGL